MTDGDSRIESLPIGTAFANQFDEPVGRLGRLGWIGAENFQRLRATGHMKPFPASILVSPSFEMNSRWILSKEEIRLEIAIRRTWSAPLDVRFSAAIEFGFVCFDSAARASQHQHQSGLGSENAFQPDSLDLQSGDHVGVWSK